jgi:hypothetical protein
VRRGIEDTLSLYLKLTKVKLAKDQRIAVVVMLNGDIEEGVKS